MSADDRPPAFLFYPRDLLTSRTVLAMSPAGRGAYLFLLCHAWLSDDPGTLPDDRSVLAALAGVSPQEWRMIENEVLEAFQHTDHGYVQPRLRAERSVQRRRLQRSIQGGWERSSGPRDSAGRFVSTSRSTGTPPLAVASAVAVAGKTKTDSVPQSESDNGHVNPVRTRTDGEARIHTHDLPPSFWNHPDTQAKLERIRATGSDEAGARMLIAAEEKATAAFSGRTKT